MGACVVPEGVDASRQSILAAIGAAWARGLNPGGEVMSIFIADDEPLAQHLQPWMNRRLTRANIREMDREAALGKRKLTVGWHLFPGVLGRGEP